MQGGRSRTGDEKASVQKKTDWLCAEKVTARHL